MDLVICVLLLFRHCFSQFNTTIWYITLPTPLVRFGISTYNDELTIVNGGGYNPSSYSYSLPLTLANRMWSSNSPDMVGEPSISSRGDDSIAVNDKIYIVNPSIAGGPATYGQAMFIFDLTLKKYVDPATYASVPPYIAHKPCVVYNKNNNMIYAIGGNTGGIQTYTQRYGITQNTWTLVSDINVARTSAGCDMDISAQHIYLFGGEASGASYGSSGIEEYTVSTNTWTVLSTTLIDPSREFSCTLLPSDGKIYCVGGRYYGTYMNSVQQFDPTDYSMNKLTMSRARNTVKSIAWGTDCLLIVGGQTSNSLSSITQTIEYYGECRFPSFNLENIALPEGMGQHGVAVYDDVLYSINGFGSVIAANVNGVYAMSLISTPKVWNYTPLTLPKGATYLEYRYGSPTQYGNRVYVVNPNTAGGTANNGQEMFIFDILLNDYVNTTTYAVTPPYRSLSPCTVAVDNKIYAIGGYFGGATAYTQVYDIVNDVWSTVASINIHRNAAGCGISIGNQNGFIYIFGGETDAEPDGSSGIEEYSISRDTWTVLSETLNKPSREFDCAVFQNDGKIYCVGGRYQDTYYQDVQVFDPLDYSMVTIYMRYPRQYAKITFYGTNCMLVMGGYTGTSSSTDTIESYGSCSFTPYPTMSPTLIPTVSPTNNTSEPTGVPSISPTDMPTMKTTTTAMPARRTTSSPTTTTVEIENETSDVNVATNSGAIANSNLFIFTTICLLLFIY